MVLHFYAHFCVVPFSASFHTCMADLSFQQFLVDMLTLARCPLDGSQRLGHLMACRATSIVR
jgi:hypothetical protein